MDYEHITEQIRTSLQQEKEKQLYELLHPLKPYDISEILLQLSSEEQYQLLPMLPVAMAAEAIEHLEPEKQYHLLQHADITVSSPLLRQLPSDVVVDLCLAVHPLQAEKLLALLPTDYRKKINQLMTYPEDTAGGLLTVDFIAARASWDGAQTLKHIRKVGHEVEIVSYVYVIDSRGHLIGIVSLKEIILASPDTRLEQIVTTDIISVPANMPQEEVAEILNRYHLLALPVVDKEQRLMGIITIDDVVDVLQEEATEDFQKLGGSQPLADPYFKTSIFHLFQKRILWLLILFIGGSYTANVLKNYQDTVDQIVALSFFIPLLIGTGGNTGSQIVTTLVRALGMGEIRFQDMLRVIRKELMTGLLLGLALGLVAFIRAAFMDIESNIAYVVSLSALFIVIWTSFVSAILPLILHRLKVDPAVVSGPLITTLVDGTGLIIYFSIAQLLLPIA